MKLQLAGWQSGCNPVYSHMRERSSHVHAQIDKLLCTIVPEVIRRPALCGDDGSSGRAVVHYQAGGCLRTRKAAGTSLDAKQAQSWQPIQEPDDECRFFLFIIFVLLFLF